MKTPKTAKGSPPGETQPDSGVSAFGTHLATKLTRSWGPTLAFIAFVAVFGILGVQIARSDVTAVAISLIVVVALIAGLTARIKNVL
jgi:hypothetical protein